MSARHGKPLRGLMSTKTSPLFQGRFGRLFRSLAPRATIGDPRNDENSIVSQLQGLFLRFHNRTVKDHPEINPRTDFDKIQQIVRFHYQFVVLNDFLPRIIHSGVLKALKGDDGNFDRTKLKYSACCSATMTRC